MDELPALDPETRAGLLKAREYIRQREGKKAALILNKIDHPIARKWERQINQAVDWHRQPEVAKAQERGPMPWYLWPLVALAALWSGGFWFAAVGGNLIAFVMLCLIVLLAPRTSL
jgi:hypothetical protein